MVRSQTFPFSDFSVATDGQLTWVYLNQFIDYGERVARIHVHCLPKFHRETCEVCHEPIVDVRKLPAELQDEVYRPGADEAVNVEIDLKPPEQFGEADDA